MTARSASAGSSPKNRTQCTLRVLAAGGCANAWQFRYFWRGKLVRGIGDATAVAITNFSKRGFAAGREFQARRFFLPAVASTTMLHAE